MRQSPQHPLATILGLFGFDGPEAVTLVVVKPSSLVRRETDIYNKIRRVMQARPRTDGLHDRTGVTPAAGFPLIVYDHSRRPQNERDRAILYPDKPR